MKIINFLTHFPAWGLNVNKVFTVECPMTVYQQTQNPDYSPHITLKCSDSCGAAMGLYYYAFSDYWPPEKDGVETIDFSPRYPDGKGVNGTTNIAVNIVDEKVLRELNFFLSETPKAMKFKKELDAGFHSILELRFTDSREEIRIVVRKESNKFNFTLERIGEIFTKIPLAEEAARYRDALGIIYSKPLETDLSPFLVNESGKINDPIFKEIKEWIDLLGKENDVPLSLANVWIRPYNK